MPNRYYTILFLSLSLSIDNVCFVFALLPFVGSQCELRDITAYQQQFHLLDLIFRFYHLSNTGAASSSAKKQKAELQQMALKSFGIVSLEKLMVDVVLLVSLAAKPHWTQLQSSAATSSPFAAQVTRELEFLLAEASPDSNTIPSEATADVATILKHMGEECFRAYDAKGKDLLLSHPALLVSVLGNYNPDITKARKETRSMFEKNLVHERRSKIIAKVGLALGALFGLSSCVWLLTR